MEEVKRNSLRAWILAARPKTLTGAITPVMIGSALAYMDGHFQWLPALICCLFAGLMQIAANFINDLFDFQKGTDRREDRLGPQRACAEGWITPAAMKTGIGIALTLSCLAGLAVLFTVWGHCPTEAGNWWCWAWCAYCLLSSIPRCSPIGAGATYWCWCSSASCRMRHLLRAGYTLNMDVVVLSLVSGLAIDTLLMVNNYRDREQDAVSGKCTLVVRYGKKFGENMYLALGIAAVLLCFWFVYTGKLTPLEFIWAPFVYLYMHALTWRKMIQIGSGKKLNSILGETSRNMLFLGLLLAVALN